MPSSSPRLGMVALGVAVLAGLACTIPVDGSHCYSSYVSSTAGFPDTVAQAEEINFACEDNEFLVALEVGYSSYLQSLKWRCSDGMESPLFGSTAPYLEYAIPSFDVAITGVKAHIYTEEVYSTLDFMGLLHVRGRSIDSSTSFASWLGPFGEEGDYTDDPTFSKCPGESSYATGVRVWVSDNYIYGIRLMCAASTDTCSPDALRVLDAADIEESSRRKGVVADIVVGSLFILASVISVMLVLNRHRKQEQAQISETAKHPRVDESVIIPLPTDGPTTTTTV